MNAPQLIRALRVPCSLLGLDDAHAARLELGELEEAVYATLPRAEQVAAGGGPAVDLTVSEERIVALCREGLSDAAVAAQLGLSPGAVRWARRKAGLRRPQIPEPRRSGWEDRVQELHARGMTDDEIAAETGFTRRTVQEYRSRLGLRVNRGQNILRAPVARSGAVD